MSGICGIMRLNGAPVTLDNLNPMTGAMKHRGIDGVSHWIGPSIGMGHCRFVTTPEGEHERLPLLDEEGTTALTWHGRIDNREELRDALQSHGHYLRDTTDAELVLKSYLAWGNSVASRILGDFAFAIWDGRRRVLVLARDQIGIKPLYYWRGAQTIRWASEIRPVLMDTEVLRAPNLERMTQFLADLELSMERTLYRDVFQVEPAQTVTFGPSGMQRSRYWDLQGVAEIRFARDDEYIEAARDLLQRSVACRLRAPGNVATELSGGLDSSAVTAVAVNLLRSSGEDRRYAGAYSLVFPGMPCDETPYIDAVTRYLHIESHKLKPFLDRNALEASSLEFLDFPDYPNGQSHCSLLRAMRASGTRVCLSGVGGDEWFDYGAPDSLVNWWKTRWSKTLDRIHGGDLGSILQLAAFAIARRMHRDIHHGGATEGSWSLLRSPGTDGGPASSDFGPVRCLWNGWRLESARMRERLAMAEGVEMREPLQDRRLVTFLAAIPQTQHWIGGVNKSVLRRSLRGALPMRIPARMTKGEFSPLFLRFLQDAWGEEVPRSLRIASLLEVDHGRLSNMYGDLLNCSRTGRGANLPWVWPLFFTCALEIWYGTLELATRDSIGVQ